MQMYINKKSRPIIIISFVVVRIVAWLQKMSLALWSVAGNYDPAPPISPWLSKLESNHESHGHLPLYYVYGEGGGIKKTTATTKVTFSHVRTEKGFDWAYQSISPPTITTQPPPHTPSAHQQGISQGQDVQRFERESGTTYAPFHRLSR